jgi:hypothetical protein
VARKPQVVLIVAALVSLTAGVAGVAWLVSPFLQENAARAEVQFDLKRIVEGMHEHQGRTRLLPTHAIYGKGGKPLLSWRVKLLPNIGHESLYLAFRLDEPWDSPRNMRLLPRMPSAYAHPLRPAEAADGLTYYQVFTCSSKETNHSPFIREHGNELSLPKVCACDGVPNTILVAEAANPVPWTKPQDLDYSADRPIPRLGLFRAGFHVAMTHGEVLWISNQVSERTLRFAITYNDGMSLGDDWP